MLTLTDRAAEAPHNGPVLRRPPAIATRILRYPLITGAPCYPANCRTSFSVSSWESARPGRRTLPARLF
ncbi:hypothetical protein ABH920_002975 [Catenulispora sp. EB89]